MHRPSKSTYRPSRRPLNRPARDKKPTKGCVIRTEQDEKVCTTHGTRWEIGEGGCPMKDKG